MENYVSKIEVKMKIPTTVIIITKNEESNIEKCLKSCKPASEIFVVDSESKDKTKQLAKKHLPKSNIVNFKWNGKWPKKKYWSLLNLSISNDWVLLLDADELPTKSFWKETYKKIKENDADGYFVRYNYKFMGKLLRNGDPIRKLVLFKKDKTHFEKEVHLIMSNEFDFEGHSHPKVKGKVKQMKHRINHDDYKGLDSFLERHNKYSTWEANMRLKGAYQNKVSLNKSLKSPVEKRKMMKKIFMNAPGKPLLYFIYSYIFRFGFLDGKEGFYFNILKAFYFFEIELKTKEFKKQK